MPRFQGGLNTRTEQGYGDFTRTLPLSGQGESGTFKPPVSLASVREGREGRRSINSGAAQCSFFGPGQPV
jgi:hypothetical protein